MSGTCVECGHATEWDADLGSAVCTQCGTLADPTQSVLSSHIEFADTSGRDYSGWTTVHGSTLKNRKGWALSGQGKEARDRSNMISMHEFIKSVSTRLGQPGAIARAQGLFDQTMRQGQYRWGRKAKLTAGASIVVALRESRKSDSIPDIAYLLEETPTSVSRTLSSLVRLLGLKLTPADPSTHLPGLRAHLVEVLSGSAANLSPLPDKLGSALSPLLPRMPSVIRTASLLSDLLARTQTLAGQPTPATACALFLLSLEAEIGAFLPNAAVLADRLGTRVSAAKGTVMQRYKIIYDLIEKLIKDVPWLEAHERKQDKAGRSKVAKRTVVARGLKDVLQFQEDIWRKRLQADSPPTLALQLSQEEMDLELADDKSDGSSVRTKSSSASDTRTDIAEPFVESSAPSRKRRKTRHDDAVMDASAFLLNPLAGPSRRVSLAASASPAPPEGATDAPDLLSHLITADSSNLSHVFAKAPTRLQLLASVRGGVSEEDIADDELFAEGELEGFMRDPAEADILRKTMGWDVQDEPAEESSRQARKRKVADEAEDVGKGKGTKRIDMEALARLLDPSSGLDDELAEYVQAEDLSTFPCNDGEEAVEEWRPLSPGGGGFDEDRYEV